LFSSFHCAHFTFSQSHLSDFVWGGVLLRDDAFEAALPAFGEELLFLKASEQRDLPHSFRAIRLVERLPSESEGSMRKSKFTDEQVLAILRRADRDPMAVVAKRHGVSEQTICCWCPASGHLHSQDGKICTLGTFRSSPLMASGGMYIQGTRKRLRL
jgi:hypothetical protein